MIEGWALKVSDRGVKLDAGEGATAYEQDRQAWLEPWVRLVLEDRACLAVTGSGLADVLAREDLQGIGQAWRDERLVGGIVRVERV